MQTALLDRHKTLSSKPEALLGEHKTSLGKPDTNGTCFLVPFLLQILFKDFAPINYLIINHS